MKRSYLIAAAAVLVAAGVIWYVTRPRPSDEQLIYQLVLDAERAAEQHNPSGVTRLISKDYLDPYGNHRLQMTRLVVGALRQAEPFQVTPSIGELSITGDEAEALLQVRLQVGEARDAPTTIFPMKLKLRREGSHWRVISAEGWEAAEGGYMNSLE